MVTPRLISSLVNKPSRAGTAHGYFSLKAALSAEETASPAALD